MNRTQGWPLLLMALTILIDFQVSVLCFRFFHPGRCDFAGPRAPFIAGSMLVVAATLLTLPILPITPKTEQGEPENERTPDTVATPTSCNPVLQ